QGHHVCATLCSALYTNPERVTVYGIRLLNKVFCYVRSSCLSSNNLSKITRTHQSELLVGLLSQQPPLTLIDRTRCDVFAYGDRTSLTHSVYSHTGLFIARRLVRHLNHYQYVGFC